MGRPRRKRTLWPRWRGEVPPENCLRFPSPGRHGFSPGSGCRSQGERIIIAGDLDRAGTRGHTAVTLTD
eukprot:287515-Alexandrium_andersonii.AAC.1